MKIKLTKIFALALILGFTAGCAGLDAAPSSSGSGVTAEQALAEAQHASAQANNAMNVASEAAKAYSSSGKAAPEVRGTATLPARQMAHCTIA